MEGFQGIHREILGEIPSEVSEGFTGIILKKIAE